ncbi:unnamed protein product [Chrysoparadoxa australica]
MASSSRGGATAGTPLAPEAVTHLEKQCEKILKHLKEQQINFLALDFDLTVIKLHTGGRWPGTPEELADEIRPFFTYFIPAAIAMGFYLAIVTFSPQTTMIKHVMRIAFPQHSEQIPIRGEDSSWQYEGQGSTKGKQAHMASAVEEITQTNTAASVTRASTVSATAVISLPPGADEQGFTHSHQPG